MRKKSKKGLSDTDIIRRFSGLKIPISVLRQKPLTTYEALILFLKEVSGFNYHHIAVLLGRDERDVRKVYFRAKKKNER